MAIFTRVVVALWAIFALFWLMLVPPTEPANDWLQAFLGLVSLMAEAAAVAGVVWIGGYLMARSVRRRSKDVRPQK
jgi:hypothetical protein